MREAAVRREAARRERGRDQREAVVSREAAARRGNGVAPPAHDGLRLLGPRVELE